MKTPSNRPNRLADAEFRIRLATHLFYERIAIAQALATAGDGRPAADRDATEDADAASLN